MADQFDPTQFGAVAVDEPFDPTQHGAIPVDNAPQTAAAVAEPPKQSGGGFISGVGSALADAVKGLIPTSTEQVAELATPLVGSVKHVVETGQKLSHIAFGGKTFAEEFPQGKTYPEFSAADYGKLIGQVGVGAAQALLIHKGLTAPLAEQAGIAKPEVPPETPTAQPTEPVATDAVSQPSTIGETGLTQSEIAANREIAPQTEPPSATEVKESFPSLLQSSEDQRRTELQQEQPTPVRQALSLDELRLMRERNELNLQNDIAQRVTGSTHPAVDERLGQIDDELTKIANRELQTERGGEIRATKEGQIAESNIPEYQGNGQGGTPAEASGSGGVVERATEQGPQEVGTVPRPEQTVPAPSAEAATTAETSTQEIPPTPAETGATEPIAEQPKTVPTPAETHALNGGEDPIGIAERYREEQQPGSVIPGVGVTADESRAWGQDFINKGGNPYDVVNNKGPKRELWQDVGVVRAEYERLSNDKRAAEAAMEANPNDPQAKMAFDNADLEQRKWSKDAQPVLTRAGDALRAASRSYPREINSFSDFTDIINDHFGGDVELTPEKRAELQKAVKAIKKGNVEATDSRAQVTDAAVKKAGGKVLSFDDLKTELNNKMTKLLEDCPI